MLPCSRFYSCSRPALVPTLAPVPAPALLQCLPSPSLPCLLSTSSVPALTLAHIPAPTLTLARAHACALIWSVIACADWFRLLPTYLL